VRLIDATLVQHLLGNEEPGGLASARLVAPVWRYFAGGVSAEAGSSFFIDKPAWP
jgi:hypothetical protein